mgnify:CR=1 FL=1
MNRRKNRRPLSNQELKESWPVRKRRVFNQSSASMKGVIKLDHETVVHYDYNGDQQRIKKQNLNESNQNAAINSFKLDSYPNFGGLIDNIELNQLKENNFYLSLEGGDAILKRNNELEYF